MIGQKASVQKFPGPQAIKIEDATITAPEKAKNIGAVMDSQMNMVSYVNHISMQGLCSAEEHWSHPAKSHRRCSCHIGACINFLQAE